MMSPFAAIAEHRRFVLLLLAAASVAATVSSARADPGDRFELSWTAPSGCPQEREVEARIRRLLGASQPSDALVKVDARVTLGRRGRLHLELVVSSEGLSGERQLDGNSCDDLAGATAVNVVLLLQSFEPPAVEQEQVSAAEGGATARAAGNPKPPEPSGAVPSQRENTRPPRAWRVLLRLPQIGTSYGWAPRFGAGTALLAGLQMERWVFLFGANLWLPQAVTALDAASAGATVSRVEGVVRACHAVLRGFVELAPCAGVSLEHVRARGAGPNVMPETATGVWIAVGVGLQARLSLVEWLGLTAHLDASWQTFRPRILIDGLGNVEPLGAAAVSFWFGTEWIL